MAELESGGGVWIEVDVVVERVDVGEVVGVSGIELLDVFEMGILLLGCEDTRANAQPKLAFGGLRELNIKKVHELIDILVIINV